MAAQIPAVTRAPSWLSQLGVGERIFASKQDKAFAGVIEAGLEEVEGGLRAELEFADVLADVTARYLWEAGGKRVRPLLTLLTAQLGAGNTPEVILAARAIEITHLASLYHDDVMDEALMRRGVPSAHIVWGNSVAVLTGDLLFARASKLISRLGERAIKLQADMFERLCLGQLHETVGPRPDEDPIRHYLQVLADKTGSLIAVAAQMGVVFSGAPAEYEQPLVTFGEKIGVAFQLVDDVIDLSAGGADTGKTPGTDLRAGVATMPLLNLQMLAPTDPAAAALLARLERDVIGSSGRPDAAAVATDAVADAGRPVTGQQGVDSADAAAAIAQLRDHPVTAQTLNEAYRWANEAIAAIQPLRTGPVKKALTRFANSIVERST